MALLRCITRSIQRSFQLFRVSDFVYQLLQRNVGIFNQRFHGINVGQRGINIHRVVNSKYCFTNVITAACGAADHLLIQNPRLNPAHKHKITNFRDIDTGSQQINSNSNIWIAFVFILANELLYFVALPGDFSDCRLVIFTVIKVFKRFI